MLRNLVLTGGWAHDFGRTAPVLAEVLAPAGIESVVAEGAEESAALLDGGGFDVLTVYACWFRMLDERYTAEQRARWARETLPATRAALARFLDAGGGLLALHTAPICFDDWEAWPGYVGGGVWGRSWHPAPGEVPVELEGGQGAPAHEITAGLDAFVVTDERYCDLARNPSAQVLLHSPGDDGGQDVLWTFDRPSGRSVYDALGHDERSLTHPVHAEVLRRAAVWAAGG